MNKIFLTGGSGVLGSEIIKICESKIVAPTRRECNIRSEFDVFREILKERPSVVIHAAAYTNVKSAQCDASECIMTNVLGTINVLNVCKLLDIKLVYISTDYVFDGREGEYSPRDPINPLGNYAKTKASAELIVRTYENSLVIRTSFYPESFPYEFACTDQWTTKDYVDIIAPKILSEALSSKIGVIHVASERRTVYDIAKLRNENILPTTIEDLNFPIPRDTSLLEGN